MVYGNFNAYNGQTINLDTPGNYTQLNFVTFISSVAGIKLGASVAGGVNILGDGASDVIIGAPSASVDGQVNTGAVYVVPTTALTGLGQDPAPIDVNTIGQSGGTSGLILAGANSGDQTGFSVADAGNVNGASSGADDLLIGAPQSGPGAGLVYLVYGGSSLPALATTANGVTFVNLTGVGSTATTAIPGAKFVGAAGNSLLGFSVSSAGDWNGDGFSDIIFRRRRLQHEQRRPTRAHVYVLLRSVQHLGELLSPARSPWPISRPRCPPSSSPGPTPETSPDRLSAWSASSTPDSPTRS